MLLGFTESPDSGYRVLADNVTSLIKELVSRMEPDGESSENYYRTRYVNIFRTALKFAGNRDHQACLLIAQALPRESNAAMDAEGIRKILGWICSYLSQAVKGWSDEDNITLSVVGGGSGKFESAKEKLFEDLKAGRRKLIMSAYGSIAEGVKADIPEEMIELQAQQLVDGFKQQLAAQGIPYDQYLKMTGMEEAKIMADAKEPAANQVKMDLAIRAIIKAEGLEVSDEEVETEMKNVADKYGMDLDTVKKYLRSEDVKEQVMREKVIKVVADSAKAVAPAAKEAETKAAEEEKND